MLGKNDPSINKIYQELHGIILSADVDGEKLKDILLRAKDIVDSYGIKPSGDKPIEGDLIANLPGFLFNAVEELDTLITTEKVKNKGSQSNKISSLKEKLKKYSDLIK